MRRHHRRSLVGGGLILAVATVGVWVAGTWEWYTVPTHLAPAGVAAGAESERQFVIVNRAAVPLRVVGVRTC